MGFSAGTVLRVSARISQVRSVLPSSTTTISCGIWFSRSSRSRCSTVERIQPSSLRAGITMLRSVNGSVPACGAGSTSSAEWVAGVDIKSFPDVCRCIPILLHSKQPAGCDRGRRKLLAAKPSLEAPPHAQAVPVLLRKDVGRLHGVDAALVATDDRSLAAVRVCLAGPASEPLDIVDPDG